MEAARELPLLRWRFMMTGTSTLSAVDRAEKVEIMLTPALFPVKDADGTIKKLPRAPGSPCPT